MANYVPDTSGYDQISCSGPDKQTTGPLPYNAYDRTSAPAICTINKTPNYVLITKTMTKPFGFFFGSSASFSENETGAGKSMNSASHYDSDYGLATIGTRLDLHPSAWSGSTADAGNIKFIYRSGKSTGGR